MGQRSQIYVMYNGKLIIANYYQWNYSERMISRARYGIEYIASRLRYSWIFERNKMRDFEELKRIFDVNFDMKDYQKSVDLIDEYFGEDGNDYKKYGWGELRNFLAYAENNNGQLLIDINISEEERQKYEIEDENDYRCKNYIKYAFVEQMGEYAEPMNSKQYLFDTNIENTSKKDWAKEDKYTKKYTKENIKEIDKMAKLMTQEEVQSFTKNIKKEDVMQKIKQKRK